MLDAEIEAGDFRTVGRWLDARIWSRGSLLETKDLLKEATGQSLDPGFFRAHLERRYLA